jgi:DNA end-binding protein Ku
MHLIEKRIKAGQTEVVTEPEEEEEKPKQAEVVDLMALLKRSVQEKGQAQKKSAGGKRAAGRHERAPRRKSA